MNPCPCGYLGDTSGRCHCTPDQIARYRARLSGPLLDRIDMHVEVPRLPTEQLSTAVPTGVESSARVRQRVEAARRRQLVRSGKPNHALDGREIDEACPLQADGRAVVQRALERLGLSARAYHRVLKLARTIADLAQAEQIQIPHLSEAIGYRRLDRGSR
jgi:magnesium chelatase family protein